MFLSQSQNNSKIMKNNDRQIATNVTTSVDEINKAIQIVVHPLTEIISQHISLIVL